MLVWYNGYQFSKSQPAKVYNPYSILLFLSSGELANYWFATGTPIFLVNLIKAKHFSIPAIETAEISPDDLNNIELDDILIVPLLFQAGYLTIKSYNPDTGNYQLVIPNLEVRFSFFRHLLKQFSQVGIGETNKIIAKLIKALKENNIDLFCRSLRPFFADIPSGIQVPLEKYYQTIIYVLIRLIDMHVDPEVMTNTGRIDLIVKTPNHIYIFEFKTKGSAQDALQQIEDKKYYEKYLMETQEIVLIGLKFNIEKRNVEEWLVKNIKPQEKL
jgi:hypothetical protein